MSDFLKLMEMVIDFMNTPFTIWGYTFSIWSVILFTLVFGLVCDIISEVY